MKKISRRSFLAATAALAASSLAGCGSGDGTVDLTFQIWDVSQRDGMQAMCDAYTALHPEVTIEVNTGPSWKQPPWPSRPPTFSGCTPTRS